MTLFTTVIVTLLLVALVLSTILELAQYIVMGPWLKEAELDRYLGKYYEGLRLNPYSNKGTLLVDAPKYVARNPSILSAWYIEDYGTIPRWSKWHGKLEYKRKELMKERVAKKLSEL